jgi:hypothetical protein
MGAVSGVAAAMPMRPIFWGGGSGRLAAFDVSDAANPSLKSVVNIATNGWNFSNPFVVGGLVYLSHQNSEQIAIDPPPIDPTTTNSVTDPPPPGTDPSKTNTTGTATGGWGTGTNIFIFVTRSYLDVVDYADPANPVVRQPVNIPGSLQGASHEGGVIYTTGMHFNATGGTDGTEFLDASAYDGVSAFLIDSLSLTNWPHTVVVNSPDIFIGRPDSLERWQLSDAGLLRKISVTDTKEPVYTLRFFGGLAALTTNTRILLYDASNRGDLKLNSQASIFCNAGSDLQNADGSLQRGLFIPLSDYGVQYVQVTAAPPAQ